MDHFPVLKILLKLISDLSTLLFVFAPSFKISLISIQKKLRHILIPALTMMEDLAFDQCVKAIAVLSIVLLHHIFI